MTSLRGPILVDTIGREATTRLVVETPQTLAKSSEKLVLSIPPLTVKFMDIDVQESAKGWSHVDLVMSDILAQTLYQLQLHITKELSQIYQATEANFEVLVLKHVEVQKDHLKLQKKHEEIEKF